MLVCCNRPEFILQTWGKYEYISVFVTVTVYRVISAVRIRTEVRVSLLGPFYIFKIKGGKKKKGLVLCNRNVSNKSDLS